MQDGNLFYRIDNRVRTDKEDSDYAYYHALCLKLEYVTKVVTAGVVACIGDDVSRHRYSLEHRLIRANSIGDWANILNKALVVSADQFIDVNARSIVRELTERVRSDDWRYMAVADLNKAAKVVGAETQLSGRLPLRQVFQIGATFRNRSRGHGATTMDQCARACVPLAASLDAIVANLQLFNLPWTYLHRNLSGKYRVTTLLGDTSSFDYLKRVRNVNLPNNGVYFYLKGPVHVPLIFSDPNILDIFLPNGNFRQNTFECLSYVTNQIILQDNSPWMTPPDRLPRSETEGRTVLDQYGNTFSNVPPQFDGYIRRRDLEKHLETELLKSDRHRVITLTGPGGIGKTTIAIAAIDRIALRSSPPYEVILWISARDIDLLEYGPKPVTPRVVTQRDISLAAVRLLAPAEQSKRTFSPDHYFQNCLAEGAAGPTLFVLDNFETVQSPKDVFNWIDTYIRPPNKALITTRFRDFNGDYSIKIGGMTDDQASALVDKHATRLQVSGLLKPEYKRQLISEAEGHPYVIKILLGQVAQERRAVKPERIIANADDLLKALFERTYNALSPGGRRVFLLLCSWRVYVPEIAVEAVLLRPGIEKFDVKEALREVRRFSLIDQIVPGSDEEENESHVGAPLAAAMYGRRKLEVSPLKVEVAEDRKLLMDFGPGTRTKNSLSVLPRIDNLIRAVAKRLGTSSKTMEEIRPILEYLASRLPTAYLRLSDLAWEAGDFDRAKGYVRNYLENDRTVVRLEPWRKMAQLCQLSADPVGEVHALTEVANLMGSNQEELGRCANHLNARVRALRGNGLSEPHLGQIRRHVDRVIERLERLLKDLSATNCSRLAWLYVTVGMRERALDIAKIGNRREPENDHCKNLMLILRGY